MSRSLGLLVVSGLRVSVLGSASPLGLVDGDEAVVGSHGSADVVGSLRGVLLGAGVRRVARGRARRAVARRCGLLRGGRWRWCRSGCTLGRTCWCGGSGCGRSGRRAGAFAGAVCWAASPALVWWSTKERGFYGVTWCADSSCCCSPSVCVALLATKRATQAVGARPRGQPKRAVGSRGGGGVVVESAGAGLPRAGGAVVVRGRSGVSFGVSPSRSSGRPRSGSSSGRCLGSGRTCTRGGRSSIGTRTGGCSAGRTRCSSRTGCRWCSASRRPSRWDGRSSAGRCSTSPPSRA